MIDPLLLHDGFVEMELENSAKSNGTWTPLSMKFSNSVIFLSRKFTNYLKAGLEEQGLNQHVANYQDTSEEGESSRSHEVAEITDMETAVELPSADILSKKLYHHNKPTFVFDSVLLFLYFVSVVRALTAPQLGDSGGGFATMVVLCVILLAIWQIISYFDKNKPPTAEEMTVFDTREI